jgi:hypothetical protein
VRFLIDAQLPPVLIAAPERGETVIEVTGA